MFLNEKSLITEGSSRLQIAMLNNHATQDASVDEVDDLATAYSSVAVSPSPVRTMSE
jgi:hypothetical protein